MAVSKQESRISLVDYRFLAQLILYGKEGRAITKAIVDTGAVVSVFPIRKLFRITSVGEVLNTATISGAVEDRTYAIQQIRLQNLVLQDIELGSHLVWITTESSVSDAVIGMDILSTLDFEYKAEEKMLYFHSNIEVLKVTKENIIQMIQKAFREHNCEDKVLAAKFYKTLPKVIEMSYADLRVLVGKFLYTNRTL